MRSICKMSLILIIFIYTHISWQMLLLWNVTPFKMSQFQESSTYCWWMFSFLEARRPYIYTLCWAGTHWAMSMVLHIPSFSTGKPELYSYWLTGAGAHIHWAMSITLHVPTFSPCYRRIVCFPWSQMVIWQLVQKATLLNQCILNGTSEVHILLNYEPSVLSWNAPQSLV